MSGTRISASRPCWPTLLPPPDGRWTRIWPTSARSSIPTSATRPAGRRADPRRLESPARLILGHLGVGATTQAGRDRGDRGPRRRLSTHDDLLGRIETHLRGRGELTEGRVLDGDGYFVDGQLVVAVMDDDLCVNVGRDEWEEFLAGRRSPPALFADLPVPGWVMVDGASVAGEESLVEWIESALARGLSTSWSLGRWAPGKTTIGERLAVALGRVFHDSDRSIETQNGRSGREIAETMVSMHCTASRRKSLSIRSPLSCRQ